MAFVIKIEADTQDSLSEHAGRFVGHYNPNFQGGTGRVWTVPDPRSAINFLSYVDAFEFWRQTSTVKPVREDGKPNRPLTAFTVSIFDWETQ